MKNPRRKSSTDESDVAPAPNEASKGEGTAHVLSATAAGVQSSHAPGTPSCDVRSVGDELESGIADLGFPEALGVKEKDAAVHLAVQMVESMEPMSKAHAALAGAALLKEIGPRSALEGMVAMQMVGTHNAAMELLRAATEHGIGGEFSHPRARAGKFFHLFTDQLEAFARLRGSLRQQRVTFERVDVHAGGQAIVGAVTALPRPPSTSSDGDDEGNR